MTKETKKKRIAVIGSGISGLSIAYLLSFQKRNDVFLFEREPEELGFCSQTISYMKNSNTTIEIDSPPRSFSEQYYVNLCALYRHLNVETITIPWDSSFVLCGAQQEELIFQSEQEVVGSFRLPNWRIFLRFFKNRDNFKLLVDLLFYFYDLSSILLRTEQDKYQTISLREFLLDKKYSIHFIHRMVLPFLSMLLTCTYEEVLECPMDILIDLVQRNFDSNKQKVSKNGTKHVALKLSQHCAEIHLNTIVKGVYHSTEDGQKARLVYVRDDEGAKEQTQEFDEIIIASQADAALSMLGSEATKEQTSILSSIRHNYTQVAIHQDPKVMPKKKSDWSFMTFMLHEKEQKVSHIDDKQIQLDKTVHSNSSCTMWASRLENRNEVFIDQKGSNEEISDDKIEFQDMLFQTWNPIIQPDPEKVLKRSFFTRPLVTCQSRDLTKRLRKIQGQGNVWFCGSYAYYQIPLQECCVNSAIDVANLMGYTFDIFPEYQKNPINHTPIKIQFGDQANTAPSTWSILTVALPIVAICGMLFNKYQS